MSIDLRARVRAPRSRHRSRAQSLVEFALVAPLLLLVFAAAADMGRAFHAYVAIENAAKEGALFGSRIPLCDDASGGSCANPNNVTWRVRNELQDQGIRNADGTELTPAIACLNGTTPRANLADCIEGDTYQVSLTYQFRPLTPMLTAIVGPLNLTSTSRAVVLNLAFDPTPGASIQKYVSPTGAVNGAEIIAKCLEPDENDAAGFYFSPCLDSSTLDPIDKLTLRFEQAATISYRLYVGNSGVQSLSGITVTDTRGNLSGCGIPSTFAVGYNQICDYSVSAPTVTGAGTTMDYDNTATIDSSQTSPATASARVTIEKPPARLQVVKRVSPYQLGANGDGQPNFGSIDDLTVTYRTSPQVSGGTVWFQVSVRNTGGQDATGLAVTDSRGAFPVNANCPAVPSTLAPNSIWICRYSVNYTSASPAATNNTVTATATNVVPDGDDDDVATLRVQACTGTNNRTVPNVIGMNRSQTNTAWTNAGFTSTVSGTHASQVNVTQSVQAFSCVANNSAMSVTR